MLELDLIKFKLETRISKDLTQARFFIQEFFLKYVRFQGILFLRLILKSSHYIVPTQILRGRILSKRLILFTCDRCNSPPAIQLSC